MDETNSVNVCVSCEDYDAFEITVDLDLMIRELRIRISDMFGVSTKRVKIFFQAKLFLDNRTLSYYHIKDGDTIGV
jgi:uncharacterized ubiquitin-like protein YukD